MVNQGYKLIFDLIQSGEFQSALEMIATSSATSPDDPYLFYYAGLANRRLNNLDAAAENYRKSLKLDSRNPSTHLGLGIVYQLQGRYDDAIESLKTATELQPNFAEAHNSLGLTYSKLGNYRRALESYERAAEGVIDLAHAELQKTGNYLMPKVTADGKTVAMIDSRAFSKVEEFLKSNLMWSINRNNIACCLAALGDRDRARELFQESIAFIPDGVRYDAPFAGLRDLGE